MEVFIKDYLPGLIIAGLILSWIAIYFVGYFCGIIREKVVRARKHNILKRENKTNKSIRSKKDTKNEIDELYRTGKMHTNKPHSIDRTSQRRKDIGKDVEDFYKDYIGTEEKND